MYKCGNIVKKREKPLLETYFLSLNLKPSNSKRALNSSVQSESIKISVNHLLPKYEIQFYNSDFYCDLATMWFSKNYLLSKRKFCQNTVILPQCDIAISIIYLATETLRCFHFYVHDFDGSLADGVTAAVGVEMSMSLRKTNVKNARKVWHISLPSTMEWLRDIKRDRYTCVSAMNACDISYRSCPKYARWNAYAWVGEKTGMIHKSKVSCVLTKKHSHRIQIAICIWPLLQLVFGWVSLELSLIWLNISVLNHIGKFSLSLWIG